MVEHYGTDTEFGETEPVIGFFTLIEIVVFFRSFNDNFRSVTHIFFFPVPFTAGIRPAALELIIFANIFIKNDDPCLLYTSDAADE